MTEESERQRWLEKALDDYFEKKINKLCSYRKEKKHEDVHY